MIRIKSLKYNKKIYQDPVDIETILKKNNLFWLNDAEIENAIIEIRNSKLYWIQGVWFYGTWEYGIWLDGIFKYGTWKGGVWYNGVWKNGTWESGVWMNGRFESGRFESGDFRKGEKINGEFKIEQDSVNIKESLDETMANENVRSILFKSIDFE